MIQTTFRILPLHKKPFIQLFIPFPRPVVTLERTKIMYSPKWVLQLVGLLLVLPCSLCIPMPDAAESNRESELVKPGAEEVVTDLA